MCGWLCLACVACTRARGYIMTVHVIVQLSLSLSLLTQRIRPIATAVAWATVCARTISCAVHRLHLHKSVLLPQLPHRHARTLLFLY
jgi:hypothetical protein